MNKAKSVCQQIFLYLLLLLSVGSTVYSAVLLGRAKKLVNGKEFIDTAARSVDEAHALLEQRDMYADMLRYSMIALVICVALLALWYVFHWWMKKRAAAQAARAERNPEAVAAEQAKQAQKQAKKERKEAEKRVRAARRAEREARKVAEAQRKAAKAEQRRIEEEKRRAEEAERQRIIEERRMAEERRLAYEAEQSQDVPEIVPPEVEPPLPNIVFCPACGTPSSAESGFCTNCGAKLIKPGPN